MPEVVCEVQNVDVWQLVEGVRGQGGQKVVPQVELLQAGQVGQVGQVSEQVKSQVQVEQGGETWRQVQSNLHLDIMHHRILAFGSNFKYFLYFLHSI